jgi:antitoxin component YwqK of YwqJK toxin-antitoxin module
VKIRIKLIVTAIILLSFSLHAQKPIWQLAPLNFIPDARSQDAQQVQDDVYSIDDLYYDDNGMYAGVVADGLINTRKWTVEDINDPDFPGTVHEYDANDNLVRLSFYDTGVMDRSFEYHYNKSNLVTTALTDGKVTSTYSYNAKNRLTVFVNLNPLNAHTKEFKYRQDGEFLKVTQLRITEDGNNKQNETSELHFLNGLEVFNSTKTTQNTYEFDHHNNWISKTILYAGELEPITDSRTITYHSERPKAEELSIIKDFINDDVTQPTFHLKVNGEESEIFTLKHVPSVDAVFIYNNLTGDYFYALDKMKSSYALKTVYSVKGAYAATPYIAIYVENDLIILDRNIQLDNSQIATAMFGIARVFYDKISGMTYFHMNALYDDMPIVPLQKIDQVIKAFYVITNEDTLVIVDKGVSVFDNRDVVVKYLENGNPVIVIDGVPSYILPPFETMTRNLIGSADDYINGDLFEKAP